MNLSCRNLKTSEVSKLTESKNFPLSHENFPFVRFPELPNISQFFKSCPHTNVYLRVIRELYISLILK